MNWISYWILLLIILCNTFLCYGYLKSTEKEVNWGSSLDATNFPYFSTLLAVRLGDVNGDGGLDLLVSGKASVCTYDSSTESSLHLYLRRGSAWVDETDLWISPNLLSITHDSAFVSRGKGLPLDIVVQSGYTIELLRMDTINSSSYAVASSAILANRTTLLVKDHWITKLLVQDWSIPKDGRDDILVFSEVRHLMLMQLINGSYVDQFKTFFPAGLGGLFSSTQLIAAVGNFNNDGLDDLYISGVPASTYFVSYLFVRLSNGSFTNVSQTIQPRFKGDAVWSDLDHDNYDELVVMGLANTTSAALVVYKNMRNGTLKVNGLPILGSSTRAQYGGSLLAADLDGNGWTDILAAGSYLPQTDDCVGTMLANFNGQLVVNNSVLMPMSRSHMAYTSNLVFPNFPGLVQLGSVCQPLDKPAFAVIRDGGEFLDQTSTLFPLPSVPKVLENSHCAIFDFNKDNCSDLYLSGLTSFRSIVEKNFSAIYLGNCKGGFTPSPSVPTAVEAGASKWWDLDNDGLWENFAMNGYIFQNIEYEVSTGMNYATEFKPYPSFPYLSTQVKVEAEDLDLDGLKDLIWYGSDIYSSFHIYVYRQVAANLTFQTYESAFIPAIASQFTTSGSFGISPESHRVLFVAYLNFGMYLRNQNGSYLIGDPNVLFLGNQSMESLFNPIIQFQDITGDGLEDLWIAGSTYLVLNNFMTFYQQLPNGSYVSHSLDSFIPTALGLSYLASIETADMDGDGISEILFSSGLLDHVLIFHWDKNTSALIDVANQTMEFVGAFSSGDLCVGSLNSYYDNETDLVILGQPGAHCSFALMLSQQQKSTNNSLQQSSTSTSGVGSTSGDVSSGDTNEDTLLRILAGVLGGSGALVMLMLLLLLVCALCCCICLALLIAAVILVAFVALSALGLLVGFVGVDVALLRGVVFRRRDRVGPDSTEPLDLEELKLRAAEVSAFHVLEWEELRIDRRLGAGAFGEVLLARWRGAEVAVKLFTQSATGQAQEEFEHEALLMAKVSHHPHMVSLLGVAFREDAMALVMELCAGGSLLAALEANSLDYDELWRILREVASALSFLHSMGVVHRDIAARNVLLDAHKGVRLGDLGLARVLEHSTDDQQTASFIGPVRWMAPESISERRYSAASDSYSFGMLIFEVYSNGKPPFSEMTSVADVALAVCRKGLRPNVPETLPSELSELLARLWSQDPALRPSTNEVYNQFCSHQPSRPAVPPRNFLRASQATNIYINPNEVVEY